LKVVLSLHIAATGTGTDIMGNSMKSAAFLIESHLTEASQGSSNAYFDLGVIYSTGSDGIEVDLIEAHKWFNLAALSGHDESKICRAEISLDMTAREIAEAQREARSWLQENTRRAA
jgi:TPR repeat protein|tara:strand:- start:17 stop:367 length:351 start_codon:yes stop_codon:yes gene_type:complete